MNIKTKTTNLMNNWPKITNEHISTSHFTNEKIGQILNEQVDRSVDGRINPNQWLTIFSRPYGKKQWIANEAMV